MYDILKLNGGVCMHIGKTIRNLRKEKGYTQKQLAELAGIATITLQQYESEKRIPQLEPLTKLANALDVSLNVLFDNGLESPILNAMRDASSSLYDDYKHHVLSEKVKLEEFDIELINAFHKLNSKGKDKLLS